MDQCAYPITDTPIMIQNKLNREENNVSGGDYQTARQYRSDMQMYKLNLSAERDTTSIKKKGNRRNINVGMVGQQSVKNVEQSPISKIGFSSIMTQRNPTQSQKYVSFTNTTKDETQSIMQDGVVTSARGKLRNSSLYNTQGHGQRYVDGSIGSLESKFLKQQQFDPETGQGNGISNELAANIVKNYVLPMFESKEKRTLTSKYASLSRNHQLKQNRSTFKKSESQTNVFKNESGTVYSELKLSDKLSDQVASLKQQLQNLNEKYDELKYENNNTVEELSQCKDEMELQRKQIKMLKQRIEKSIKENQYGKVKTLQANNDKNQIISLCKQSERLRVNYCNQLKDLQAVSDKQNNFIIKLLETTKLDCIQNTILQQKYEQLFESIDHLSNTQKLEDKYQKILQKQIAQIMRNDIVILDLQVENAKLVDENDKQILDVHSMLKIKQKLEADKFYAVIRNSIQMNHKICEIRKLTQENQLFSSNIEKFSKELAKNEKTIQMLKQRVVKANKNTNKNNKIKQCQNCQQEFEDKDNFNWSCKTHQSEYSGLLWWCCGKKSIYDEGCRTGKHESGDLSDDEVHNDEIDLSTIKCMCCKERGHKTEDCPQEPNIRTNQHASAEVVRVKKIQNLRKLFAHTNVATTQFLKTCVKVQKIPEIDEDDSDYEFIQERVVKEKDKQYNNFFQRGIMTFEDYNYQSHNPYILVNKDNIHETASPNPLPISAGMKQKLEKMVNFDDENDKPGMNKTLTKKMMNESQRSMDTYKYDDMNIESESQAAEREQEELEEKERLAKIAADNADEENSPTSPEKIESQVGLQQDPGDDESEDAEDVEYEAFYQPNDILATRERQQADLFKDVNTERTEILIKGDPKNNNFLDISSFAPIEESDHTNDSKEEKAHKRQQLAVKKRLEEEERMMNEAVAIQEANKQILAKKEQLKMQGNIKDKLQNALNKQMQDKLQAEIENLIKFKTKFRDTIRKEQADKEFLNKDKFEHSDTTDSGDEYNNNNARNQDYKKKSQKK